ncbi:SDR family oxidoreductase [Pseudomonadota bacterium]
MKSIVTGGAGFIGSHLVDALIDLGHDVLVLDNYSTGRPENLAHLKNHEHLEIRNCDIAQPGPWQQAFKGADWVFHLAARADIVPSIQDPTAYFEANVQGTFNVLEACRRETVSRFVFAASSSCYGIPDLYPTPETAQMRAQYPYALTKYMAEELVLHWAQVYSFPAVSLRFFNVYGPRSRTSGTYGAVFGVFLAQKLAGKPFTVVGDGEQTRDFTYVTDVVGAIIRAAQSDHCGKTYNVGSGTSVSVNRIVNLLGGEKVHIPKRPGEPDCTFADITRIRTELDWSPTVAIEVGVKELIEHIDYWRKAPVWTPDSIADATRDWFTYLG